MMVASDIEASHLSSDGSGNIRTTAESGRHSSRRRATIAQFGIVIGLVLIVFLSITEDERFVLRRRIISVNIVKSPSSSSLLYQQYSPVTLSSPSPPTLSQKISNPAGIVNDDNYNESDIDVADVPPPQSATEASATIQDASVSPLVSFDPSGTISTPSLLLANLPTVVPTGTLPPQRIHRNITLIVQLRGELGNQLAVLANARITQIIAETQYPHIHIQLVGQHQDASKWTRGRDDLINCFPNAFQHFEFSGGSHDTSGEFQIVQQLQQSWLTVEEQKNLTNVKSFDFLDSLLLQQEQNHSSIPQVPTNMSWSSSSKYSLPYLTAVAFSWLDVLKNGEYYDDMRQWLIYNIQQPRCCSTNSRPNDNDIVFHFRNYAHELRNRPELQSRYVEISPDAIANIAYQNYTPRHLQNVAITSRYETGTDRYIEAFHKSGISSYYVAGQKSGTEGFCFLLQAQKETFGSYQSTYYRWATLLGNATLTRFYMIDSSPVSSNITNINNNSVVVNDTVVSSTVQLPPARTIETLQQGNRIFTIEVYRQ